jgi:hypothetical protein
VNAGNANFGDSGTVDTGVFKVAKDGVSTWVDTGATAPAYTSAVTQGAAITSIKVDACQSDPNTGGPDPTTSTGWMDVADIGKLNGYRWIRFWVELKGTTVPGKPAEADRVVISWIYKK